MAAAPSRDAVDWAATRRRLRLRWLLTLAAVALLHLLLLLALQRALRMPAPQPNPAQAPPVLVWLTPPARAAAPTAEAPQPRQPARRARPDAPVRAATAPLQAAAAASAADTPAATTATTATAAASAAASAATAAAGAAGGDLLDTDASRRAIREAARQRPIGEMGAQATGESARPGAQQQLAQDIARGARGDCLKGEYAGSGMGLFSLPFWLAAELRDKCRR